MYRPVTTLRVDARLRLATTASAADVDDFCRSFSAFCAICSGVSTGGGGGGDGLPKRLPIGVVLPVVKLKDLVHLSPGGYALQLAEVLGSAIDDL
jgi:hypothetical protein